MSVAKAKTSAVETKRGPGRPVALDREAALLAAMELFWRQGYDGTSLTQLTEAMGVSRPTLYAMFGDKAALFQECVKKYASVRDQQYLATLSLATTREVAEEILRLSVMERAEMPTGCFSLGAGLTGGPESAALREQLSIARLQGTALLAKRFRKARKEGDLPVAVDPDVLAQYLSSLAYGLMVQALGGVGAAVLNRVVDLTLVSWPGR